MSQVAACFQVLQPFASFEVSPTTMASGLVPAPVTVVEEPDQSKPSPTDVIEPWTCNLDVTLTQLSNVNRAKSKDSGWTLVAKIFLLGSDRSGESAKVQITCLTQTLAQKLTLPVTISSCQDIDNLVYFPLLINFYESVSVMAKDKKKAPEEKLELLGQVTIDALPLVNGQLDHIQGTFQVHPSVPQTAVDATAEPARCDLTLQPSACSIIPPTLADKFNIITINLQSCHGIPEAWVPNLGPKAASVGFTIATAIPRTGQLERILVAANKPVVGKATASVQATKRWPAHPAIVSDAIYRQEKSPPKIYLKEQGDLCQPSDWPDRYEMERNQPSVQINTEFRCVLSRDAEQTFRLRASASMVLPFEIFEVTHSETKHAGIKKKGNIEGTANPSDKPIIARHGMALVNLKPLLYPGATGLIGAYRIKPYESNDKTKHSLGAELLKGSPSAMIKGAGQEKLEGSRLSIASKKALDHGPSQSDHHGAKNTATDVTGAAHPESDSQLYQTCKTYLYLEITLDNPVTEKKIHIEVIDKLKKLIAPTSIVDNVSDCPGREAEEGLQEQMDAMYSYFAQLFKTKKARLGKTELHDENQVAVELADYAARIRRQMARRLTDQGDFHALKEQLKLNTARLVREKYAVKKPFSDARELDQFLSDLYVELTQHVQITFRNADRHCRQAPPDAKPVPTLHDIRVLAMEAELDGDFSRGEKYFLQRVNQSPSDPNCWQDLGCFYLRHGHLPEADNAFRQMLLDNFTNFNGLLLNGYVQIELRDYEKAATFFEAAVLMYPNSALAWCALGIFNEIQSVSLDGMAAVSTERAFVEAKRASGMDERHAAKYEAFLAVVAQTGISEAAVTATGGSVEPIKNLQHIQPTTTAPSRLKSGSKVVQKKDPKGSSQSQADADKQRGEPPRLDVTFHSLNVSLPKKPSQEAPVENIFWCAITSFASLGMHRMTNACVDHLMADQCDLLDPVFWRAAVLSYIEQGRYQDADAFLERLMMRDVETADIFAICGHVKYLQGDYQQAAEAYRRALYLTTEESDPFLLYFRYARLSELHGHHKKAREMFYRAAQLHATSGVWLGCGQACYHLGEYKAAETCLQEANCLNNQDPQVWAYLGLLNYHLQRQEIAERCSRAATVFGIADYPRLMKELSDMRNK